MQADAIKSGQNVIIIDDLMATGKIPYINTHFLVGLIFPRWIGKSCGRAHHQAGLQDDRVSFHNRIDCSEGLREARRSHVFHRAIR